MPKSTVTKRYQTTIPREVREKLGVGPKDVLQWEIRGSQVQVKVANTAFLQRRGTIKAGAGSVVEDVRRARSLRGIDGS